jgi:SSS family solute:Na+ symporter
VLGLVIRRAPGWAGWSTVVVTLVSSLLCHTFLNSEHARRLLGLAMNSKDTYYWDFLSGTLINLFVGCTWFLGSCLLAARRPVEEKQRTEEFFRILHTPVDFEKEEGVGSDNLQAKIMGLLCMIYGGFVLLLMLIPNPLSGRLAFAFCGGMMGGIGLVLYLVGTRGSRRQAMADAVPGGSVPSPVGDALANQTAADRTSVAK